MNCTKCGKEILDKESKFCPYCGVSLDAKPQYSPLATAAGTLALVAAAFSAAVGVIGIVTYQTYINYYSSYGYDTSNSIGFILFAAFAFAASAVGFASGTLALARKRYMLSITGPIIMFASALFTFVAARQFEYGFSEGILLSGISIGALSIISTVFTMKSKAEFAETTEPESEESTEPEESEPDESEFTEATEDTETEPQQ